MAAPFAFIVLPPAKMAARIAGVYPVARACKSPHQEAAYTTLLLFTGLTFGTFSALFGLSRKVIDHHVPIGR